MKSLCCYKAPSGFLQGDLYCPLFAGGKCKYPCRSDACRYQYFHDAEDAFWSAGLFKTAREHERILTVVLCGMTSSSVHAGCFTNGSTCEKVAALRLSA
jgi:hypothetical protein